MRRDLTANRAGGRFDRQNWLRCARHCARPPMSCGTKAL